MVRSVNTFSLCLFAALILSNEHTICAAESLSGIVTAQTRIFTSGTHSYNPLAADVSVSFQPRYFRSWKSGAHSLVIEPFVRLDQNDSRRSHVDFRELYWRFLMENVEVSVGYRRVFWGVTESQHLVDFINQHDFVDGIEPEDRLGQPMLSFELFTDWGDFEFHTMPVFRERTFPGTDGNLRGEEVVNSSLVEYESDSRTRHLDLALRWSHTLGRVSYSLGHFSGTNRQPHLLQLRQTNREELAPRYELINRTSLELQIIQKNWMVNLETLALSSQNSDHFSFVTGLERSYTSITGVADLRTVIEYHFDSRGDQTPQNYYNSPITFQNDLFLGARLFLNDFQSSEFTLGAFFDVESAELAPIAKISRRIINNYTVDISFAGFLSLELARHF